MSSLASRLAGLTLQIETSRLELLELATADGWTRYTTVFCLQGGGCEGRGEDVIYDADAQLAFQEPGAALDLAGRYSLDEFSRRIDSLDLFPTIPGDAGQQLYRRWGLESAALSLALKQCGASLHGLLEREPKPLRYSVSLGLGDPSSLAPIQRVLSKYPAARFKVDFSQAWTPAVVEELAALDRVDVVDLKGLYRGAFQGPPANPDLYRLIAEKLADCWLEDPELNEATHAALEPHMHRVTWDANLHALADLFEVTEQPQCVNVKPSRFGFFAELLRFYEYCEARGIKMYGGGQFELGPGRGHIQALASMFHPNAPNDMAPSAFNELELSGELPRSPMGPVEFV